MESGFIYCRKVKERINLCSVTHQRVETLRRKIFRLAMPLDFFTAFGVVGPSNEEFDYVSKSIYFILAERRSALFGHTISFFVDNTVPKYSFGSAIRVPQTALICHQRPNLKSPLLQL